ncbi:hypothetical protein ACJRO7_027484 [Eucalyptus globulus]|uniref:TIR domain-containing protein n=1 Tax=Eucalyptus globulus TaxID=34317 RepID=A0ABD3JW26_EUCGL
MKRKKSSSLEIGSTRHGSSGTKFEVFLSFRGSDTRTSFTDVLYHALLDKGISVFLDEHRIDIGEEIGPEIFQAIDDSKICIPIFSRNYASSSWCLRELEHMMQRRKTNGLEVSPIFYDVEPSDVKLKSKVYKDALTLHKKERGVEIVKRWKEALKEVAKIKGWDTKGHGKLAKLIAQKVLLKLKEPYVHITDNLVGMDESVNEVVNLLDVKSTDVRLIGICGMGGIGKTTLAKVVYHKLSTNFESQSFIADIREASNGSSLLNVQRQLISDIIGDVGFQVPNLDSGMAMIQNRFGRKKVLIFLDDVDHTRQLTALAAKEEWFGLGSRIIVTTRDKSVFSKFKGQFKHCLIYEAKELENFEALQLFSKHAFRRDSPPNAFLSLSEEVITKTSGLPLAIEVAGSFLCDKSELVWQDTLKKMHHGPLKGVKENLMLSYEALECYQQQIFLDIACFLAGYNKSYAAYMWHDCEFFPEEGIVVLLLMSLVKIGENNELWMHDQLKDLGRSIEQQQFLKDPTKGSRVYRQEEGPDIVQRKKGTGTVAVFGGTSKDFIKMPDIRFLHTTSGTLCGDFEDCLSELRWLCWHQFPTKLQATNFCPKNLLILDLSWSSVDEHWGGWTQFKVATRLKVLNLSCCDKLKETPDLSAFLFLELLILRRCSELTTLPNSIEMLQCLVELDVSYTSFTELPNTIVNLKSLKLLKMNSSHIQKLPKAIGMMEKLEEIYGENCKWLEMIPIDIVKLRFLKILKFTCTRLKNVPKLPQSLVSLCLSSSTAEKILEISNLNLPSIRNLEFCFSGGDNISSVFYKSERRPHALYSSSSMKLPSVTGISSFGGWLHCTELQLSECKNLRHILRLPSGLRKLEIRDCPLLEVIDLSNLEYLLELRLINDEICVSDIQRLEDLASLRCLRVRNCKSSKFSGLERLKNLRILQLWMCPFLQTLPNLSNFKNLQEFVLWCCPKLIEIEGLDRLKSLERLDIRHCSSLRSLPNLSHLKKLKMNRW